MITNIIKVVLLSLLAMISFNTQAAYISKLNVPTYTDNNDVNNAIEIAGDYNTISTKLIRAVIAIESGFHVKAYSSGNYGLMQVNAKSHPDKFKKIRSLYNPYTNVMVGSRILRECLDAKNGNIRIALMCYNAGMYKKRYQKHEIDYSNKVIYVMNRLTRTKEQT